MKVSQETIQKAYDDLALAYRSYSTSALRWDYLCNISTKSKALIMEELKRRKISMETFNAMGRGERAGGGIF